MSKYTIIHNPPGVEPGTILDVVACLDTYDEVMDHYDKVLMVEDPEGVQAGHYQIDHSEPEYDGSYVENHCDCGEFESECICDE